MRLSSLLKLSALLLFTLGSVASANIFEAPLKLEEKTTQTISDQPGAPELRYVFFHDPEKQQDLFHSVRLYDEKDNLLQTIEGEMLREHMFWGLIGNTPTLVDINEDGYLDLIIKVSAGSLGEFSTVWLFNSETNRYQEVLEELLYPTVEGTNLISSAYTSRRDPYPTSISLYEIQPDLSVKESHWESALIPVKKGNEGYYCLSYPMVNNIGPVDYSLMIELDSNDRLTAESLAQFEALNLDEYCYPTLSELSGNFSKKNYRALPLIQLNVWQENTGIKSLKQTITIDENWTETTTDDDFGNKVTAMKCPIIPYIHLDQQTIEYAHLPAFENLAEKFIYDDYGYPVICEYAEKPYSW